MRKGFAASAGRTLCSELSLRSRPIRSRAGGASLRTMTRRFVPIPMIPTGRPSRDDRSTWVTSLSAGHENAITLDRLMDTSH